MTELFIFYHCCDVTSDATEYTGSSISPPTRTTTDFLDFLGWGIITVVEKLTDTWRKRQEYFAISVRLHLLFPIFVVVNTYLFSFLFVTDNTGKYS